MKETIDIFGMTCMHCHKRVTDAVLKVSGVLSIDVSLENSSATVEFDESVTSLDAIKQAVVDAGYEVGEKTVPKPDAETDSEPEQKAQSCPIIIEDEDEKANESAPMTEPGSTASITLKISGMTCAACASNIEKVTKNLGGVISSTVNVAVEKASITYDPTRVSPKEIEGAIKSIGYGVVKDKISFDIGGMTCAACAQNIEKVLKKLKGVEFVAVNFSLAKASVEYDSSLVSVPSMISAIEGIGYTASRKVDKKESEDRERKARENEIKKQRTNLIIAVALGIPISLGDMSNAFPNL
ncbi:MAG: copper ion binding protein, partial [Methanosarcinaceae archaeon]|nr:copper ion binding protein [Methanosarcinaceae archaeon]